MKVGIIGAGKIGTALGNLTSRFSDVVYIDKKEPFGNDYSSLQDTDLIFVCVNTASDEKYDMTNVVECLESCLVEGLKNVVIVSTCPPSFFDTDIYHKCCDVLTYSPFFIRQGSIECDIVNAEFVLVGRDKPQSSALVDFYTNLRPQNQFIQMGCKEAAVVKMGINGFLTLKLAYANMLGDFCVSQELDQDLVLQTIGASRSVGTHYFKYGFGFGGPCLPIDNVTLATEINKELPLSIDRENAAHLEFMIGDFCEKNSVDGTYTFTDIGYKSGVPIITKSQKLLMAVRLAELGYKITIQDSHAVCDLVRDAYPDRFSFDELD